MSIKLEVIIPTTRNLTEDERREVSWFVYNAILEKSKSDSLNNLNLQMESIIVNQDFSCTL